MMTVPYQFLQRMLAMDGGTITSKDICASKVPSPIFLEWVQFVVSAAVLPIKAGAYKHIYLFKNAMGGPSKNWQQLLILFVATVKCSTTGSKNVRHFCQNGHQELLEVFDTYGPLCDGSLVRL